MFLTKVSCVARPQSSLLSRTKTTLAIRRETINVWERRAPLAPKHVKKIVDSGVKVLVQPSTRRAFYMQEYEDVGATITEDLSSATHIIGVKAPEPEELIENKCYAFFSHTIKAQPEGMALLDEIIRKNITLLDYEKMTNENGQRNVAFGHYAGVAGMINVLHGLGLRMLSLGVTSPFLHIGLAHNYAAVADVVPVLQHIGESMKRYKLPRVIAPLTFSFTGSGNVSQGARSIFEHLPHEYIEPGDMREAAMNGDPSVCYATVLSRTNSVERIDGKPYSPEDYLANGELYRNIFADKVAPYTTCLVNGLYWEAPAPRVLSDEDAVKMFGKGSQAKNNIGRGIPQIPHKMLAIADITCDIGGSIEFSTEPTTVGSPFQIYDPKTRTVHNDFSRDGVVVMSIDNLPCQLPREATEYFGNCLDPHIYDFLSLTHKEKINEQTENTSPCIERAIITSKGALAPAYKYIKTLREEQTLLAMKESRGVSGKDYRSDNKRVLLLGTGLVSEPVVEYLTRSPDVKVTVGSNDESQAIALARKYRNTVPQVIDASDRRNLTAEIAKHDLVISMLPHNMHPFIAELCLDARRNMLTASYATDELKKIAKRAAQKGIIMLNEVGLDPGIDHMMALNLFDDIRRENGTIESFESFCGGLPAPQFSNNPLRYKFTWFPRGVLLNALSEAKFLKDNKEIYIASGELMKCAQPFDVLPGFNLECYPNRDSTIYKEAYGIESAHTVVRGTLRYKGYSSAMDALLRLGVFKSDRMDLEGFSWADLTKTLLGSRSMTDVDCKKKLLSMFDGDRFKASSIPKLGLLDADIIPAKIDTPLDALVHKLASSLMMPADETDVIIMNHSVGVRLASGKYETHRSNLVVYGEEGGWSAMSKTVGLPVGIAAEMIMNGEISERGSVLPFSKEIYEPMLKKLELEGISERREVETEDF